MWESGQSEWEQRADKKWRWKICLRHKKSAEWSCCSPLTSDCPDVFVCLSVWGLQENLQRLWCGLFKATSTDNSRYHTHHTHTHTHTQINGIHSVVNLSSVWVTSKFTSCLSSIQGFPEVLISAPAEQTHSQQTKLKQHDAALTVRSAVSCFLWEEAWQSRFQHFIPLFTGKGEKICPGERARHTAWTADTLKVFHNAS